MSFRREAGYKCEEPKENLFLICLIEKKKYRYIARTGLRILPNMGIIVVIIVVSTHHKNMTFRQTYTAKPVVGKS